jgi:hypothetical protein
VALAQQYVEVFRLFDQVESIRFEVFGDANLTNIVMELMKDSNFPWFEKVTTIKCYCVRDMTDSDQLQTFFTHFRNLETLKGVIEEEFGLFGKF